MTEETRITALVLPDEDTFKKDMDAINRFQKLAHANMIPNQDYGIIPGTQKPTLLKPGAEKIVKLLGLADQYEILNEAEDWDKPFFRYLIRCSLVHVASGAIVSQGLGECNSMEAKYRWRWVSERDLPLGTDKSQFLSQERRSQSGGGHWKVYRLANDDIYSQVNTILKMAKKRALVDAALSAGRLSNIFTQDIEDTKTEKAETQAENPPEQSEETHAPPSGVSTPPTGKGMPIREPGPPFKQPGTFFGDCYDVFHLKWSEVLATLGKKEIQPEELDECWAKLLALKKEKR